MNRVAFEAWCLLHALLPMDSGAISLFQKLITVLLMGVWVSLVLELTAANPPDWLLLSLTALMFSIIGRMWGIEAEYWLNRFSNVTIEFNRGDEDEYGRDRTD